MRGYLISFEGLDGSGKTSAIDGFVRRIYGSASTVNTRKVIFTREPGGTPLAEFIRDLVINEPMDPVTESLLLFAARRQHVKDVIEPALANGCTVVTDRFADSTFAYQGGGKRVSMERLRQIEEWTLEGLKPDLTLWFDASPEVAAARRAGRGGNESDRFEREDLQYFERVRLAYFQRANEDPQRVRRIDASLGVEQVGYQLETIAREVIALHKRQAEEDAAARGVQGTSRTTERTA